MGIKYCIGDLHGRQDLLRAARNMIKMDAKKHEYTDATIVYLGDYIDRGMQSKGVLTDLVQLPMDGFKEVYIKGNHEDMMLKSLGVTPLGSKYDLNDWRDVWIRNGGAGALFSFGIFPAIPNWDIKDPIDQQEAFLYYNWDWRQIKNELPAEVTDWMKSLKLYHAEDDYFFCHAGADPFQPLFGQAADNYLWIRDKCYNYPGRWGDPSTHGYKLVHGHTPTRNGKVDNHLNRLNMDTGAVWTGVQAIAVLGEGKDGDEERFLYTPKFDQPKLDISV